MRAPPAERNGAQFRVTHLAHMPALTRRVVRAVTGRGIGARTVAARRLLCGSVTAGRVHSETRIRNTKRNFTKALPALSDTAKPLRREAFAIFAVQRRL